MADETNNGIAYLKALRQSDGPSAASPADSASPDGGADTPFHGPERRRSTRYNCRGSARLCEDGCDVSTWVTLSDISMHGCYVEAQATFPVGTLLHMKLEANNVRIETTGTVRVNYPYLGMGIAFSEMSDNSRAQLRELISSLSSRCLVMGPGIASSLPTTPLDAVPVITDPTAAIRALIEFFEGRPILMRDDFLKILKKSQSPEVIS
jgi:hypothetical protein